MAETSSNSSHVPPKGRAKACTACRQVKLKCDAREVYPQPCTRCRQQSLDCRMDPTFKRVPARRQLEEVSNRLANLQKSLGLDHGTGVSGISSDAPQLARIDGKKTTADHQLPEHLSRPRPRRPSGLSSGPSSPQDHPSPQYARFIDLIDENEQGTWTLGDLTLEADQLLPLFHHFDAVLWRHMPVLEPCHSLASLYQSSELLFWTIVLVSARLYNEYATLYLQLVPRHRTLLSNCLLGQRTSLKTIHAILLLCTWPYPVSSQYDDITWMLCGAAINLSMMMGLHKPLHTHEYGHEYERIPGPAYIRHVTWLALFTTTTSVGSWLGMPPPLCTAAHFETIDDLCRDERLPKAFRAEAAIQRQVAQFSTALDSKIDFRTRFSLIKMYEHEIDRIQNTFADAWSDELEINWLAAKIFLVGMAFISNSSPSSQSETENRAVGAREMLQHGLSAASRLLSTISNIRLPPTHPGENKSGCSDYVYQLAFYPKQTFRIGAFANFYLLWYLAVDAQASDADKELAKTWVTFTYRLLGAFKHSPEHLRAAKGIELMARLRPSEQSARSNHLVVNSRLGASIMYSYHFRDCNRLVVDSTQRELPLLGLDTIGEWDSSVGVPPNAPHDPTRPNGASSNFANGPNGTHDPTPLLSSRTHPDATVTAGARIEEISSPDSDRAPRIRLDDFTIAYGTDRDPEPSVSSPDGSSGQSSSRPQSVRTPAGPGVGGQGVGRNGSVGIGAGGAAGVGSSGSAGGVGVGGAGSGGAGAGAGGVGGTLPPGQMPLPAADFNSLFSNAFFQDAGNQEFDFLWQEWDPAVFDDLKMDVDSSGAQGPGQAHGQGNSQGHGRGQGPGQGPRVSLDGGTY